MAVFSKAYQIVSKFRLRRYILPHFILHLLDNNFPSVVPTRTYLTEFHLDRKSSSNYVVEVILKMQFLNHNNKNSMRVECGKYKNIKNNSKKIWIFAYLLAAEPA